MYVEILPRILVQHLKKKKKTVNIKNIFFGPVIYREGRNVIMNINISFRIW
jgi:hypothetical protein